MPQGVGNRAKSSVKRDESLMTFLGWVVTLLLRGGAVEVIQGVIDAFYSTWDKNLNPN